MFLQRDVNFLWSLNIQSSEKDQSFDISVIIQYSLEDQAVKNFSKNGLCLTKWGVKTKMFNDCFITDGYVSWMVFSCKNLRNSFFPKYIGYYSVMSQGKKDDHPVVLFSQ